jgi:hypothetical protein
MQDSNECLKLQDDAKHAKYLLIDMSAVTQIAPVLWRICQPKIPSNWCLSLPREQTRMLHPLLFDHPVRLELIPFASNVPVGIK